MHEYTRRHIKSDDNRWDQTDIDDTWHDTTQHLDMYTAGLKWPKNTTGPMA